MSGRKSSAAAFSGAAAAVAGGGGPPAGSGGLDPAPKRRQALRQRDRPQRSGSGRVAEGNQGETAVQPSRFQLLGLLQAGRLQLLHAHTRRHLQQEHDVVHRRPRHQVPRFVTVDLLHRGAAGRDLDVANVPDVADRLVVGREAIRLPALVNLHLRPRPRQGGAAAGVAVGVVVYEVVVGPRQHPQHGDRLGAEAGAAVDVEVDILLALQVALLLEVDVEAFPSRQRPLHVRVQVGRLAAPGEHRRIWPALIPGLSTTRSGVSTPGASSFSISSVL